LHFADVLRCSASDADLLQMRSRDKCDVPAVGRPERLRCIVGSAKPLEGQPANATHKERRGFLLVRPRNERDRLSIRRQCDICSAESTDRNAKLEFLSILRTKITGSGPGQYSNDHDHECEKGHDQPLPFSLLKSESAGEPGPPLGDPLKLE